MKRNYSIYYLFLLVVLAFCSLRAGNGSGNETETLHQRLKHPHFSIGLLVQTVADFQSERTSGGRNGFTLATTRLLLSGKFENGFAYFVQTDFIRSPILLDARLSYRISESIILDAGQFKTPFSSEFMIYAANIDFINRARMVSALNPGRQVGLQTQLSIPGSHLRLLAGAFNGNGPNTVNDNNSFLYAGKLYFSPLDNEDTKIIMAVNFARSEDNNILLRGFSVPLRFTGQRRLSGADFNVSHKQYRLSGEYIRSEFDGMLGSFAGTKKPQGFHLTAGYFFTDQIQILLRREKYAADKIESAADLSIVGLNIWPTDYTELQVNLIFDNNNLSARTSQLLINAQVSL